MKILHVLTQLPQKTGSGVYFTNLIKSLEDMGHENLALYGREEGIELDFPMKNYEEVLYMTDKLPFHICGMSDVMPYESTVYSQMTEDEIDLLLKAFEEKLIKIKKEFKPELIISHNLFFLTDLVRRTFPDVKVVGISHGTDIRQIKKHPRFLKRLSHIKELDQVLTVTDQEDETIREKLGVSNITLIGGGFNQDIFYENPNPKKDNTIRIMYAGKITRSKGVFELVKTINIVEKKYENIKLYIVGNASEKDLKTLKENANYSKNLIIHDAEDQKTMADHLREKDIFVLPSYFEALGLVAIEALACHKLVVTSYIEGLDKLLSPKIKEKKAIEFVSLPRMKNVDQAYEEDKDAYVERLAQAIDKQIQRIDKEIFTEEIVKEIDKYSWKNMGRKIFEIIK